MRNKVIAVLFCVLLFCAVAVPLFVPDKYYSEAEKRKLTQAEQIKVSEFTKGTFQTTLDKYLADQFPMRDGWIALKTLTDLALGKRDSGGVYFGKDGYLIAKCDNLDAERTASNTDVLKSVSAAAKKQGATFAVMPVPTAVEVLSSKLPAYATFADQTKIVDYIRQQGLNVADVCQTLKAHSGEYVFYRTDHHFTSLGAYYCYAAYRQSQNLPVPSLDDFTQETLCDNFYGTSYAKVNYPFAKADTITAYYKHAKRTVNYNDGYYVAEEMYERKYLETNDQYAAFLNSNQAQTVVSGSGAEGKLLLIKDSYGNSFAQFPAEDYAEVHLLDLRFYRGSVADYIAQNGITDVLVIYGIPNYCNDVSLG